MDEDELDQLIDQIEQIEEEELENQLFLDIFDVVGTSEKAR